MTNPELYNEIVDRQTWVRIQVAKAAYAYEIDANPIMDDGEYDKLASEVDVSIDTRRSDLDLWFRKEFSPHTGQWIWNHPDLEKIAALTAMTRSFL